MFANTRHFILKKCENTCNWSKSPICVDKGNLLSYVIFFCFLNEVKILRYSGNSVLQMSCHSLQKTSNNIILPDTCIGFRRFIVTVIDTVTDSEGMYGHNHFCRTKWCGTTSRVIFYEVLRVWKGCVQSAY